MRGECIRELCHLLHPAEVRDCALSPRGRQRAVDLDDEIPVRLDEVPSSLVIEACIRIKHLDLLSELMRR